MNSDVILNVLETVKFVFCLQIHALAKCARQKMPFLNCVTVTQIMCKHGFLHAILRQNYIEILIRDDV